MAIDIHDFGTTEHGEAAHLITLTNRNGVVMKVTTYGGATQVRAAALPTASGSEPTHPRTAAARSASAPRKGTRVAHLESS